MKKKKIYSYIKTNIREKEIIIKNMDENNEGILKLQKFKMKKFLK